MPTNQQRRDAAKRKLERQLVNRQERAKTRRQRTIIGSVIAGVVVIAVGIWLITGNKGSADDTASDPTGTDSTATATTATTPCTYPATAQAAVKDVQPPTNTNPATTGTVDVAMSLGEGTMAITLDRSLAPCAVNAFVSLASQKFYDGTSCHRITTDENFKILQCGDPSGTGRGGPGYEYAGEPNPPLTADSDGTSTDPASTDTTATETTSTDASETSASDAAATDSTDAVDATETTADAVNQYPVGTVAMANTTAGGNSGSQFFIVYGESDLGDSGYTKIGTVDVVGVALIEQIAAKGVKAGPNGADDAPIEPVNILTVTVPEDAVGAEAPPVETTADSIPTDAFPTDVIPTDVMPTDTAPSDAPVTTSSVTDYVSPATVPTDTSAVATSVVDSADVTTQAQ